MKYNINNSGGYYEDGNRDILFSNYLGNYKTNYFDQTLYSYNERNLKNEYNKALVFMTDEQESERCNISNVKIINISDIVLLNNDDNNYQKLFIKNNSKLIIDMIKEEIKKDNINEIMMYSLIKIIKKILNYFNKEDILTIFKFLWDFYNKNKLEENKWIFMSQEYIEYILMQYYDLNLVDFTDMIGKNKESLSNLFIFIIKGNSLSVKFKIDGLVYLFNNYLDNPIKNYLNKLNKDVKNIYNIQYQATNLLLYDQNNNFNDKIINSNSILFVEYIDLSKISKIIEQNNKMIKVVIIIRNKIKNIQSDLIDFVNYNKLPIYEMKNTMYDNDFTDFFLKIKN